MKVRFSSTVAGLPETEISPDGALNLLTAMHRHGASRPDNRGFFCHINKGTINQGGERQPVRRIEDDVVIAGILGRLLFGSCDHVEALLFIIGHYVIRGENDGGMPGGILLVNADKYDVPAVRYHSDSPNVLWR